ncbi:ARABIDOPSIS TOXICOS EN LEVADURA 1 [Hibiscus trionum]|uniref:RING-type E3 ubiquitin transferase n=1 Tax=Hibiscus trionum TaxID=183268 RepID=A0A9W7JA24_HIBTR|nr:ARABIDOPSIS TOXICOS EN LEVADURA 1 [Hibiscus trionum]
MAPDHNLGFQALSHQPPLPASDPAFPILAIVVLSIMGTAFLLVSYYVFVSKCCSSDWYQLNLLSRVSLFRARREEDSFIAFSPTMWNRGLDESVIREIPTFQFKREGYERSVYGCVVCLNEFQEHDMLRVLPKCSHAFHLDCIDIWLQSNANCPLCRTSISGNSRYPINHIIAPSSSPQDSQPYGTDSMIGGDEDYVVIELGEGDGDALLPYRTQEIWSSLEVNSRESPMPLQPRGQSPRNLEQKHGNLKSRKRHRHRHHLSIMGDECIDVRQKDDNFSIQPIRRSFSLDSAVDRQLYQSIQAIVRQNRHPGGSNTTEECSNRAWASLFPFELGRSQRNVVLPA